MALVIAGLGLLTSLALVIFDLRDSGFQSADQSASTCSSAAGGLDTTVNAGGSSC